MKKTEAIPLSSLFAGDMELVNLALSLPTTDPVLAKAIADERDRCAAEFAKGEFEHVINSKKGGEASVQARRSALASRNVNIADKARKLLSKHAPGEVCAIVAKDAVARGLGVKSIRTILQEQGVLKCRSSNLI